MDPNERARRYRELFYDLFADCLEMSAEDEDIKQDLRARRRRLQKAARQKVAV